MVNLSVRELITDIIKLFAFTVNIVHGRNRTEMVQEATKPTEECTKQIHSLTLLGETIQQTRKGNKIQHR
jgi:hypothetical protein